LVWFWEETLFFRGAGEVLQGSLVRLVSLWWEFFLPGLIPILVYRLAKSNSFLKVEDEVFLMDSHRKVYSIDKKAVPMAYISLL
jgi:hypothetical protein